MLQLSRPPCAASARAAAAAATATAAAASTAAAPTAVEGLGVQRNKLRSAQDAVPLPRPGSPRRHVEDQAESSSVASTTDSQSPQDNSSGASLPRHEMSQDQPLTADLPPTPSSPPVALIDIFRRAGMRVDHAVYNRAHREG